MAATSFIDVLNKEFSYNDYYHATSDGSGFPKNDLRNFMFATGIECSYPTIDNGRTRRDQLEECGHYKYWKEDLHLVKELGLNVLRYGLPYYSIHQSYDKFDWSFSDEVMNEIKRLNIVPILDLMHFGVPDWIGNFQNPELPYQFCRYAAAVVERYPWVRFYTPVNEIYVTARASAKDGIWNEQMKDDRSFVTAMKNIVAASIMATHRIVKNRPDAVIIQSETAEVLHEATVTTSKDVVIANKLRFLSLDLLYSHAVDPDVCLYLMDNGLTREEMNWFMTHEAPGYQVMGNDYYGADA